MSKSGCIRVSVVSVNEFVCLRESVSVLVLIFGFDAYESDFTAKLWRVDDGCVYVYFRMRTDFRVLTDVVHVYFNARQGPISSDMG